jgi:hypothetical protein
MAGIMAVPVAFCDVRESKNHKDAFFGSKLAQESLEKEAGAA